MADRNQYLPTPATTGIVPDIIYAGTDPQKVQQLIDLVSIESSGQSEPRNMLDGMFPSTRDHLVALLVALKAAVT